MAQYTISLAQMQIKLGDVEANLETFRRMSAQAAAAGSLAVIFPELWSTGYVLENADQFHQEQHTGAIYQAIEQTARTHHLIIIGSILERLPDGRTANSLFVTDRNGTVQATYHKLHLFRLFEEDQYLQQGSYPLSMTMPWGKTGFSICYDLRFPELFRSYTLDHGTQAIIIPAEWPQVRIEHWRTLLKARAIENQSFVFACNAAGSTGDTTFGGHSAIIDPWGEVLVEGDDTPQLLTATIETETIEKARKLIPVFDDMRHDVY